MTAIDGQTRISDDNPDQPLQARYRQKMTMVRWLLKMDLSSFHMFFLLQGRYMKQITLKLQLVGGKF